ncbi:MAG: 50S ribosomal protein L11 methyltransferase [Elusimicrobia bacterium]|nr:50S ribosomal protein L11 methyltransferase [Elusimicrobiota bacterium]
MWPSTDFVRVGPLFFLDESRYGLLSPALRESLGGNAVRVADLHGSIIASWLGDFTIAAAAVMLNNDLSGRHVIDAGAGDGMLSLVALKLGAASADLVDLDREALGRAKINLRPNGFSEQKQFRLINGDLAHTGALAQRLTRSSLPSAVISNIGCWEYAVTNADSMLLMDLVPAAGLFIAGGYSTRAFGGLRHLENDEGLLGLLGFSPNPATARLEMGPAVLWPFPQTVVAMSAARAGGDRARLSHSQLLKEFQARRKRGAYRLHALFYDARPALVVAILLFTLYLAFR